MVCRLSELHGIPVHLSWLLIYPHEWEEENYLHGVEKVSPKRVIIRAENWGIGCGGMCGGQWRCSCSAR